MSAVLANENDVDTTNTSAQSMTLFLDMELTESGHRVLTKNSEDKLIAFLASDHNGKVVNPYHMATEMAIDEHSDDFVNALRQLGEYRMANHRQYLDYVADMANASTVQEVKDAVSGIQQDTIDQIANILLGDKGFQAKVSTLGDGAIERIVTSVKQTMLESLAGAEATSTAVTVEVEATTSETCEDEDAVGLQSDAAGDQEQSEGTHTDAEEPTEAKSAAANQTNNGNVPLRRRNNH